MITTKALGTKGKVWKGNGNKLHGRETSFSVVALIIGIVCNWKLHEHKKNDER